MSGRNLFKRQYVRLKHWFTLGSIGITPRLLVAFAAVAALVATANLIVENGVAMVERQRTVERERSALDSQAISTLRESVGRAKRVVTSAELARALDIFERETQKRADADSREAVVRQANARATLDRTWRRFQLENASALPAPLPRLIDVHKGTAEALIQASRVRSDLHARYGSLLAGMEARVKAAVDRAWKVLGRVVTQQPLLEVRAQLIDLRAALAGGNASSIALAQRTLSETLRQHEGTLRQSQGSIWFQGMSDDLTALLATRAAVSKVEARYVRTAETFARESRRLLDLLPMQLEEEPAMVAEASAPTAPSTAEAESYEKPNGSLVAWISGVVLVVLFYICFATILSIVRPVRSLIAATHRLAKGGNARVAAHGGIREIDSLTQAFNSMAEQLAVARSAAIDAQQKLEAKVEERTYQLQELAEKDPLTGIANRRQLFAALNELLERARGSGERIGVFFLDIDNFKTLNDCMGHPYGDRVLVAIARRLEELAHDCGFAARLGGDEFTIVHHCSGSHEEILNFGAAVVRAFDLPLQVDEREVIVSVSVGASLFPDHESDAEALLRAADAALFRAKALGRSQLAVFTPELLATASAKFDIEQKLRRAIQNDEFELFYQPLVDPQTFQVSLAEALIRWRAADGTYRAPDEFLAVAEESGLIVEISDWVLRTAIRTAAEWHRGPWPDARVAINVSPRQFLDYRFVDRLAGLLQEYQLPARCIELEIIESVLQTGSHTIRTLDQLRSLGVAVALDDFGTGYSSLASLQQLPLTRVKFDRSLIAGIDGGARSAAIVRATIALCRSLGLDVTAEGVERIEQLAMLLPQSPITLQGFLFSRPVSGDQLIPLLKRLPETGQGMIQQLALLPAAPVDTRTAERRRGKLTLVKD